MARAVEDLKPLRTIDAESGVVRDFLDEESRERVHALSCPRKIKYATQDLATIAADSEGRRFGAWLVPYQCVSCGSWHIGRRLGQQYINGRRPTAAPEREGEWEALTAEKHRNAALLSGMRGKKNPARHRKRQILVERLSVIETRLAEIKVQRQSTAAMERLNRAVTSTKSEEWRLALKDRLQKPFAEDGQGRLLVRTLVSVAWLAEEVLAGTQDENELRRALDHLRARSMEAIE